MSKRQDNKLVEAVNNLEINLRKGSKNVFN